MSLRVVAKQVQKKEIMREFSIYSNEHRDPNSESCIRHHWRHHDGWLRVLHPPIQEYENRNLHHVVSHEGS